MTTYPISSPQYILLRKSLEQQFPNSLIFVSVLVAWESGGQSGLQDPPKDLEGRSLPLLTSTIPSQEEEISAQATGEFEVFVDGKLIHSKKVILSKVLDREGGWSSQGVRDLHVCALSLLCPEW